jgi:hypothetical protein
MCTDHLIYIVSQLVAVGDLEAVGGLEVVEGGMEMSWWGNL